MTSGCPDDLLQKRIEEILDSCNRLFLATSCDGNSSGASVFYARDGDSLVFFTFNASRKAEQIRANPRVQAVIWPPLRDGIRSLEIEGRCALIRDPAEIARARRLILAATDAFGHYMDDEFLSENGVTGYYRLTPAELKYVDFHADPPIQGESFEGNQPGVLREAASDILHRSVLWLRALRAPFFSATVVSVLLGAAVAARQLHAAGSGALNWRLFALVLAGAAAAHAGTNLANDYGDHVTGNDAINRTPGPFNGGSRVIQAGLLAPWKILWAALLGFAGCIACGLTINAIIAGAWYAPSPLLAIGIAGVALGVTYTLGPFRLSYRGLGEAAIAAGFGPLMILGSHYVLTAPAGGPWRWSEPLAASLPMALLTMLIVWINQFQDAPADAASGKNTWVVRLAGGAGTFDYARPFRWYVGFYVAAFALILALALLPLAGGPGTGWAIIALAPAALVPQMVKRGRRWLAEIERGGVDWRRHPYALLPVNAATIAVHLAAGLLLGLAYVLDAVYRGFPLSP